ncbi:MAG TPA: hypothetical protein VJ743_12155, partial [Albitalea sp.]|nr:hypothetical protein [Albitalea sp.]
TAEQQALLASDVLRSEGRAALMKALQELMAEGDAAQRHQPWDITMPAGLASAPLAQPFDEPLDGMAIREVQEPSVFRRFFRR